MMRFSRSVGRLGFSLVELLVVIAIIGVLVGLLLPAVQSVRESARRSQCTNNLRQLGLGLHLFADATKHFPSGYVANTGSLARDPTTYDALPGTGWGLLIAPFVEESMRAASYSSAAGIAGTANRDIVSQRVGIFLCPSSSGPREAFVVLDEAGAPHVSGATLGRSDYIVNAGNEAPWGTPSLTTWDGLANGPLYRNSKIRPSQVSDGLSKTVFLGEHSQSLSHKTWAGIVPGGWCHPSDTFRTHIGSEPDCAATFMLTHSGPASGELFIIHVPSDPVSHVDQMFSEHSGGVNVLLGDGSVRFASTNINHLTWAALCSMAEADTVGEY